MAQREERLEAEDSLKRLGAVAKSRNEAPMQLAGGDEQLGCDVANGRAPPRLQAGDRRHDEGVVAGAGDRPRNDLPLEERRSIIRRGSFCKPLPSASEERPQIRSRSTSRSTSSEAGSPRIMRTTPGRKRTPTRVVPGASNSTTGPRWGPVTRTTPVPRAHEISTEPLGTVRCSYTGYAAEISWTHTHETRPATPADAKRSR